MNSFKTKKTLWLSGLAIMTAAVMTSCSSDEPSESLPENKRQEISFAANMAFAERSGDYTTNNLKKFYTYAYTGSDTVPSLFMDNVEVTKGGANTWTYSPVTYWPANSDVDFYAYAPEGWVPATGPLFPIPYDNYWADTDLIYAVSPNLRATTILQSQVVFNFRHALSKVTVKLSSNNKSLRVQVSNVALAGLNTQANFNFPRETTVGSAHPSKWLWTDHNTPTPMLLHMSQTPGDVINLTSTPNDMSAGGWGGPKYIIPQPLYWDSNGEGKDTYITIMCSVYDAKTGEKLWPNANTAPDKLVPGSKFADGLLKFPLSSTNIPNYEAGWSYVYNLIVNSNEDMGQIQFGTPTVYGWDEVTATYD